MAAAVAQKEALENKLLVEKTKVADLSSENDKLKSAVESQERDIARLQENIAQILGTGHGSPSIDKESALEKAVKTTRASADRLMRTDIGGAVLWRECVEPKL